MQHKCVYAERLSPYMLALSCFAIFQYDKSPWPWGHRVQAADRRTSKLAPAMSPGRIVEALMHPMKDDAANQHWALASRSSVLAGRMRPDSARE